MILIKGKYNEAKVFTSQLESKAKEQIQTLVDQPFTEGLTIRVMPDVHAGAGSTIGTTMTIKDKVVPNLVGVDIGCGMLTTQLREESIDFPKLDRVIREQIPSGFSIRNKPHAFSEKVDVLALRSREGGKNDKQLDIHRAMRSIGTLGGGNHFIEINQDEEGRHYLVIHSGSRNIGLQVALYYQKIAAKMSPHQPRALEYLEGPVLEDYLHDMKLMQEYALKNRKAMADIILNGMGWEANEQFSTIHNYIDLERMILRKGAVSSEKGEKILIPLNMRDGSLLCIGKGNQDWNTSAPHGAGRVMSRTQAKKELSMREFHESMKGVYSSSVRKGTLDEAPMVYKDQEHLMEYLHETCDIQHRLRPLYNFKAS
jgi:tRNA-splicing ligase RtcB